MARITGYLIGLTALTAVLCTIVQSQALHRTKSEKAYQYYTVTSGSAMNLNVTISPALAADLVVFEPLKFKYPAPVNAGKRDNRLAFAQYHIDYNVASHYRS